MADIDSRRSTNPSYIIADILTHHSNTVILNKSMSDAIFLLSSVNVQSQFLVYDHFICCMRKLFWRWEYVWRCRLCSIDLFCYTCIYANDCDALVQVSNQYMMLLCVYLFKEDVYMVIVVLFSSGGSKIVCDCTNGEKIKSKEVEVLSTMGNVLQRWVWWNWGGMVSLSL